MLTDGVFRPLVIGYFDLDSDTGLVVPSDRLGGAEEIDALSCRMLVRLHGHPVGMILVDAAGGRPTRQAALVAVQEAMGRGELPELAEHARADGIDLAAVLGGAPAGPHDGCSVALPVSSSTPRISVIVPTAGRASQLGVAIESLLELKYPDFEILIVDNRPADPSTRRIVEGFGAGNLRYLAEEAPGSSVARNRGIAEATGEILAFTDDDVIADPLWLQYLADVFSAHPQASCVTGLVTPLEARTQAQVWFEEYGGFGKGFRRTSFHVRNRPQDRPLYPFVGGVFGSGNNMAFRASSLRAIGGFDPSLGAGSRALAGADIESFIHLLHRGETLVYEPAALVWHQHRTTYEALRKQVFNYGVGFTAILTKWVCRDPRLLLRLAAAVPAVVVGLVSSSSRHNAAKSSSYPAELAAVERRGFLRGPVYYVRSLVWARRLGLFTRPWREG